MLNRFWKKRVLFITIKKIKMQAAIQELINKRHFLIAERDRILGEYHQNISEMENAIEILSGKRVWEILSEEKFDDENPNYIKGSYEEM